MESNEIYDTLLGLAIIIPSLRRYTTLAAGAPFASTFAAASMATILSGPVPVGVPIVVSSSRQGGTSLEYGVLTRELRLAELSAYAARHLEKAKDLQGAIIEVPENKSKEKLAARLFKIVKLEVKTFKLNASRSIKTKIALVKVLIKHKGKVYSLADLKAENGDACFDIEEKLTALNHKHNDTQHRLTEFHKFPMLPIELQDEIWRAYVAQNPQILTLPSNVETRACYPGNQPLILRQINKRLRAAPIAALGYVTFSVRAANDEISRMGDPGFAINPTVDLLYIPDATLDSVAGGFRGTFGPSAAISQVRVVAIDLYIRPSNIFMHVWRTGMHEWISLELVMIAVQEDTTITDRGSFYFKTMTVGEHLPRSQRHSFEITLKLLQLIFTRGSCDSDIVPRIVPVCKFYTG